MCNPRRVAVTVTRQIHAAWERAVTSQIELHGAVQAEVRNVQRLNNTVAQPVLDAIDALLAAGVAGWEREGDHFRYRVPGGWVRFRSGPGPVRELETVATGEQTFAVVGQARDVVRVVRDEAIAHEEVKDLNGYVGNKEFAQEEEQARKRGIEKLDLVEKARQKALQDRVHQEGLKAAARVQAGVQREAEADGQGKLQRETEQRRAALEQRVHASFVEVGRQAHEAFQQLLRSAHERIILDWARRNHAEHIQRRVSANGDVEIEFIAQRL